MKPQAVRLGRTEETAEEEPEVGVVSGGQTMAQCAATCSWTYHTSSPHWTKAGNCGSGCTCPPQPNPNPLPPNGTSYWYHCQPMGADFELTLTRRITVQLAESDALAVYASKAELETSVRVNDELQGACVVEGQV